MPTADEAINSFLKLFNAHDKAGVMKTFCPNGANNKIPSVGLTHDGPQFLGAAKVEMLITQMFTSFPDIALTPLDDIPDRLYSRKGPTRVALQGRLAAAHEEDWFPTGHPHYSPPISDIHPDKVQSFKVPVCAVFTLDDNNLISNWTLYFDRYRMAQQLTPGFSSPTSLANSLASVAQSLLSLGRASKAKAANARKAGRAVKAV